MEVYTRIWRYLKVYKGIWRYIKVYESIWRHMEYIGLSPSFPVPALPVPSTRSSTSSPRTLHSRTTLSPLHPSQIGTHKFWFLTFMAVVNNQKSALEMAWCPSYENFININLHFRWHGGENWTYLGPQAASQSENLSQCWLVFYQGPHTPWISANKYACLKNKYCYWIKNSEVAICY